MKVTIKGFVHWHKYLWDENPEYQFYACDMSDMGPDYVLIMPHEFNVDIPDDFDPRPRQIEVLRAKKQQILAETQQKVNNIEDQIQRLLCIEHKPEVMA